MKNHKSNLNLLTPLLLAFSFAASTLLAQTTASNYVNQGLASLTSANPAGLANAYSDFNAAVALSPTNEAANALLAVTRLLVLPQQPAGSNFLNSLGFANSGRDLYDWTSALPKDDNGKTILPSENSSVAIAFYRTNIIPALAASRTNLARITDPGFTLTLTAAQTSQGAVTADYGDILLMQAELAAGEFLGYTLNAQNFDVVARTLQTLDQTNSLSIQVVLADYTSLLAPNSAADLANSKAALTNAIASYQAASYFIRNLRQSGQGLFLLSQDEDGKEAKFRTDLTNVLLSLNGPVKFNPNDSFSLDLSNYFSGAKSLRSLVPQFNGNTYVHDSVPDYTFGGILAGEPPSVTESFLRKKFDKHDYSGIYTGQVSDNYDYGEQGVGGVITVTYDPTARDATQSGASFAVFVSTNQQVTVIGFDASQDIGLFAQFALDNDGSTQFTNSTFSGFGSFWQGQCNLELDYDNGLSVYLYGNLQSPLGPYQSGAGYYSGTYSGADAGTIKAIFTPDGGLFFAPLTSGLANDGGLAQMEAGDSFFGVSVNDTAVMGAYNPKSFSFTGTYLTDYQSGGGGDTGITVTASYGASPNILNATVSGANSLSLTRAASVPFDLPPVITVPPANKTVAVGSSATFSVTATGGVTLGYQWYCDGQAIKGATSSSLVLTGVSPALNGNQYSVAVENVAGTTNATAVLTVTINDTLKPALSSLNLTNGQPVGNPGFPVTGAATDSYGVSAVWYQLNNTGPWLLASTTNNWTNWSANLSLATPGPNTLRLFTQDIDTNGAAYVADSDNNLIRKVSSDGAVTTLAGDTYDLTNYTGASNAGYADGADTNAMFNDPSSTAVDGAGNIYVADTGNNLIRKITPDGVVTTLAGDTYDLTNNGYWSGLNTVNAGYADGTGANAMFYGPTGVAVDASGNVYVADYNNSLVRKITPAGVVTTLAGDTYDLTNGGYNYNGANSGYASGTGARAQFDNPTGVAVDASGNVYVADTGNSVIRKITPAGVVTTLAGDTAGLTLGGGNNNWYGTNAGYADGSGSRAQFCQPAGVAVDGSGNVFVADSYNNLIRKITSAGVVTTLAGDTYDLTNGGYNSAANAGYADGTGTAAQFNYPVSVAVDAVDNVLVADRGNNLVRIITPDTVVATLAGDTYDLTNGTGNAGYADGTGAAAQFDAPAGAAADGNFGSVSPITTVTFNYVLSSLLTVQPNHPGWGAITPANDNGAWLVIGSNYTVKATAATGFAFTNWTSNFGLVSDSPTLNFQMQSNLVLTANFMDITKPTVSVANVPAGLSVTNGLFTVTGKAGDNVGVAAVWYQLNNGSWMIASTTNQWTNWWAALPLNPGTNTLRTYAGDVNSDGLLYVADANNNLIRKLTAAGVVTTLAGDTYDLTNNSSTSNAGYADGTGTNALFNFPNSTAADGSGNIYVADTYNNLIRKITPAGLVTTLAGDTFDLTNGGYNGGVSAANAGYADGTNAMFNYPSGIATDAAGNVYVADTFNELIRKITPAGVVTTLAGDTYDLTNGGYSGGDNAASAGYADGTGAAAQFNYPADVSADAAGNIYVADANNNLIRKITPAGVVTTLAGDTYALTNGGYNFGDSAADAGYADGTGTNALFNIPLSTTVDGLGNLYVADYYNNLVRKITPAGVVTTLAGDTYDLTNGGYNGSTSAANAGYADGAGAAAKFNLPVSTAVDGYGTVFVTDFYNELIRKITPAGVVTTLAGDTYDLTNGGYSPGISYNTGYGDGTGSAVKFNAPFGVAADGSGGNLSPTNTVTIFYDVTVLVSVQTNQPGWGFITPNDNGKLLPIGVNDTLTATAAAGFKFVGWTNNAGFGTNAATLTFLMASNLTFTANFADNTAPTVAITAPTPNLLVSNTVYTVTGTAHDNVVVSNVFISLNGSSWTAALPTIPGNWSNWTAQVTLTQPSNSIAAYAVGASSLVSTTNTVNFKHIASVQLTVQTNQPGWGSITPNLNGAWLQSGTDYSLTAAPASGFVFNNWTGFTNGTGSQGVILTTGKTLTFPMVSNLVLTANFMDTNRPTVVITAPAANARVSNGVYTVTGTAHDNAVVSNVVCFLNSVQVGALPATPGNWSNWTAQVTLTQPSNTIAAYAVGASDLVSPTNTVSFKYVASVPLTVLTNQPGWGAVTPYGNGAWLQSGSNYNLTATAATGFQFVNWTGYTNGTGAAGVVLTTGRTLAFTMVANLELTANFADTNRPAVAITNMPAGLQVSNATFVVKGTASDNVAVSNVFYSLNGSPFTNAVTANDWSNWTAQVILAHSSAGGATNTVVAYAVGTGGETSAYVTNRLTYHPVYAPLTVLTNQAGWGVVSPNANNALLAIGSLNTLTATPNPGYAFTNWTSNLGLVSDSPTLSFTMQTNLVLTANFVPTQSVVVDITNVPAGLQVSNQVFTVAGAAGGVPPVAAVWYQLNNGPWSQAVTTNNWTNWSATLPLTPGTNLLRAFAEAGGSNEIIYVADAANNLIRAITADGLVTTLAGDTGDLTNNLATGNAGYADGAGAAAQFNNPDGVAVDGSGNVYVADSQNNLIRKITPGGVVTTLAGDIYDLTNGGYNYGANAGYADGPGATAKFNYPVGIALDGSDNVYVAEIYNNLIRKITPAGLVTTLAGDIYDLTNGGYNGGSGAANAGYADGTGGTALFNFPAGLAVDPSGNLCVADYFNNLIRKITPAGVVTTLAGDTYDLTNGGYNGGSGAANAGYANGAGAAAQFDNPTDVAVDGFGNVYVTDSNNNLVREVTPAGVVSTLAGDTQDLTNNTGYADGPDAAAQFNRPFGLAVDALNNVYVADEENSLIREINSAGVVTTLAGDTYDLTNGGYNYGANAGFADGLGEAALFNYPIGVTVAGGRGGVSLTNTVTIDYVEVNALLTVLTNQPGWGAISPNDNGALLAIGSLNTLTATPNPGYVFTNWTSNFGLASDSPTLNFTMQPNLVLTANFVNVQLVEVGITDVPAGLQVGNQVFTITGTASGLLPVASVYYQLNHAGWMNASTVNAFTNWSAAVLLLPGTNTIQAYAVDASGNVSLTDTVSFEYVVTSQLGVQVIGLGTISPNYSNAWLAIGGNYSMTAAPAAGFVFTNWTSNFGVVTNGSTLIFTMESNLVFTANFVDVTKPVLAITSPTPNQQVSNTFYTVTGTAEDNVAVAAVFYQLNDGGWLPASTANGWTNWLTPSLTLVMGTNNIRAYAVDTSGNVSVTNSVNFVNLQAGPAPSSLDGLVATVTPDGGSVITVGFGANTFSQSATDTNDNYAVGTYTYTQLDATTAQLTITPTAPPTVIGGGFAGYLTFNADGTGTFSNANNGNTGAISLAASTSLVPATVAGKTALFINGGLITLSFGNGTVNVTKPSGNESDTFAFQPYSPVGALLTIVNANQDTNYFVASFLATNHGLYFGDKYDSAGDLQSSEFGGFVFPSASPVAPVSLNGCVARTTRADESTTTLGFDASTFSMTGSDTNHDSDVGTYVYTKIGATNAELTLTPAAPPTETNNGGSVYLTFVADNFCLFTNQNDGSPTISGLGLKAVTNLVPSTLAGKTSHATNNVTGAVDVITYSSGGNFTQTESNSEHSGTSTGSYTFTAYSPIAAMLNMEYTSGIMAGFVGYVQITFTQTQAGTCIGTFYDSSGVLRNVSAGTFSTQ